MSKAIFTTSEGSAYDDQPEVRYHFPRTYLRQVEQSVGDWIIYYEPRRALGPTTGRQSYFAIAFVDRVERDIRISDHFYAHIRHYIEMDGSVPFRVGLDYYESGLRKVDGSTNKGAFGRAVRLISEDDFARIVTAGFTRELSAWEAMDLAASSTEVPERVDRPVITQVITRKFRDEAFRRHVRDAYCNTCAVTGLKLINGNGRPEVQAAHIRPVEKDGPDTVRNGLALTGTVHWLFDRGLISINNDFRVMLSPAGLPDDLERWIPKHRTLTLPLRPELRPHPTYLGWHRDNRFKT